MAKARPLAVMVDEYYAKRIARLDAQKKVDAMDAEEKKIKAEIIDALKATKNTTGIAGKVASVQLVDKESLVVEDWDALYRYILKNKAFELLQRRLGDAAAKERLNDGKVIPGVNRMHFKDLSLSKL